jgi:hypothetical protein
MALNCRNSEVKEDIAAWKGFASKVRNWNALSEWNEGSVS